MKPITTWTMRMRRVSTIWWVIGVIAFIMINMVFYPTFKNDAAELEKSFANIPDSALQLFGGSADFFSPVGYLNSQIFFLMLPLLLSVLAIGLGSSLLAREEQDKTVEVLLAHPVSRGRLLAAKALAGWGITTIVSAAAILTIALSAKLFDVAVPVPNILLAGFDCWLLVLATGAIAFLLTCTGRARGAAVGLSALVAIGGYIIASLAGTVDWLKTPAKALPFNYYQPEAALRGHYDWSNILFPLAVIAICIALSYVAFRRRDLM